MRILLAEDDQLLADGVVTALRRMGYSVDWCADGLHTLEALRSENFDLLLLDLGLPRLDGIDLLRAIRESGIDLPVLILTARDPVIDRVKGLDAGADDYLVKPVDLDELAARIRALIRRSTTNGVEWLQVNGLEMDIDGHRFRLEGDVIDLSRREFSLLQLLLQQHGRVVSKGRLEETIYGWGEEVESNALEVHIHHLRKKIGKERIKTVRGVGYQLE